MKSLRDALVLVFMLAHAPLWAQDLFDRIAQNLSIESEAARSAARLSGTLDLEAYAFAQPPPGLIFTSDRRLFNPRLSLFLDAYSGPHVYSFIQARVDRGFDPSDRDLQVRIDEFAVRLKFGSEGRLGLQVGQFSSAIGRWSLRHGSWENPFVTAPLAYEHLTAMWDSAAARSTETLLKWAHLRGMASPAEENADRPLRLPIIWGPAYSTGIALFGTGGPFEFIAELKNASLSSRPAAWNLDRDAWKNPTFNTRIGYRPSLTWNFGLSASTGSYLLPTAKPGLVAGTDLGDYRQTVVAFDASYAWRHLQAWIEVIHGRFEVPRVGLADTLSSFLEVKHRVTPRFAAAVRVGSQTFGSLRDRQGSQVRWGRDVWRVDLAPSFRFSANLQAKLQYSLQEEAGRPRLRQSGAAQLTLRF